MSNRRALMVIVPYGTEVIIIRPGAATSGLRVDGMVLDSKALTTESLTEQARVDDWFVSSVMTCLAPKAPIAQIDY